MTTEPTSRTIQDYIDERPRWADDTLAPSTPMTSMQWWIWGLASAGKFFEGMVVFMTGIALPLIVLEFNLDVVQKGMVSAAVLFGILIGATVLGSLSDRLGRKTMFIAEMVMFMVFLICTSLSSSLPWLLLFQFGLGMSLGCDYPTAHTILSESVPSSVRGRLVLGAFAFQAVGALAGAVVGLIVLQVSPSVADWRWMYASAILPALVVLAGRFFIPQSGQWLVLRGRIAEAERETEALLRRNPPYPQKVTLDGPAGDHPGPTAARKRSFGTLFSKKYRRATILASVPWFLQDLGTYGIGMFTPTILAATVGARNPHARNVADVILGDIQAARGAAMIDVLLIVGIVFAVFLADKVGRIRLQVFGFLGCAAGLFLASCSVYADGAVRMLLLFAGFMVFNFMTNIGPNAMTYLIAGEVFPTRIRGVGAGFAASFAKIGAVTTSFLFPILLKDLGTQMLLSILIGTSVLGAVITWRFGIETRGVNLETIGQESANGHGRGV